MEHTFSYRLGIETAYGCSDTIEGVLTIYQPPLADFFVTPEIQNYPATSVSLDNLSSPGDWSYLWEFGDGNSDAAEEPGQHVYANYGDYDISLVTFSDYCRDSVAKSILIMPPPPLASFEFAPIGCPPLEVFFTNRTVYADSYLWEFDDGTFSTEPNPSHVFYQSKDHQVKLTAYGLGGRDSTEKIVIVATTPVAVFSGYPTESKSLSQLFRFINSSVNGVSYLWDFGDGVSSIEENPSHTYGAEGVYTVTLVAWSENDCVDTLVQESLINVMAGEGESKFPNAFVWNGSGPTGGYWEEGTIDNSVFHPHMVNPIKLRMIIYNRWGDKLYESNEVNKGWDGYLESGILATEGVYVYKCWVTYVSGHQEILAGDVTFLH
jgi:PKD repeat protein